MHCVHRLQVFASMDCEALKSALFTSSTVTTPSLVSVYSNFFFILLWLGLFGLFVWGLGGLFELFVCSFFVGLFWGEALTFWPLSCFFSLTTLYKLNVLATLKGMPEILDATGAVSVGEHTGQ